MRDLAQVRRSIALVDHDHRRGEIGELVYRQLRSKLNARLAELDEPKPPERLSAKKKEPREIAGSV